MSTPIRARPFVQEIYGWHLRRYPAACGRMKISPSGLFLHCCLATLKSKVKYSNLVWNASALADDLKSVCNREKNCLMHGLIQLPVWTSRHGRHVRLVWLRARHISRPLSLFGPDYIACTGVLEILFATLHKRSVDLIPYRSLTRSALVRRWWPR